MNKSPLGTPCGTNKKQNWKSYNRRSWTGYNYVQSDNYECTSIDGGKVESGNDFIPLNISTPVSEQRRFSGNNWYGGRNHRNSGSGGFNHYRNNYHATPKSNFNNTYSPYKQSGTQYYGQRKGYQRDPRKHDANISRYIDMKSFLEDPWAELEEKLNNAEETNEDKSPKIVQSHLTPMCSESNSESISVTTLDSSCFSTDSKSESAVDAALGLDDTDVSYVSNAESSIDLKLDSVRFSQDSKNDSICSNSENSGENINNEDNVAQSCASRPNEIKNPI